MIRTAHQQVDKKTTYDIDCQQCGRPAVDFYRGEWLCTRCRYNQRCEDDDRDERYEGPTR